MEIIEKRKQTPLEKLREMGDFLSILLTDDLFDGRDELILDECLTFFFAGSQTSSVAHQNLIMNLIEQPDLMKRVRDEIKKVIIDPYKKAHPG